MALVPHTRRNCRQILCCSEYKYGLWMRTSCCQEYGSNVDPYVKPKKQRWDERTFDRTSRWMTLLCPGYENGGIVKCCTSVSIWIVGGIGIDCHPYLLHFNSLHRFNLPGEWRESRVLYRYLRLSDVGIGIAVVLTCSTPTDFGTSTALQALLSMVGVSRCACRALQCLRWYIHEWRPWTRNVRNTWANPLRFLKRFLHHSQETRTRCV